MQKRVAGLRISRHLIMRSRCLSRNMRHPLQNKIRPSFQRKWSRNSLRNSTENNTFSNRSSTSATITEDARDSINEISPKRTDLARNVEALLFLTREPLSVKRMTQLLSWEDSDEILETIRQLNKIYDASHCAFRILEFARGFQLRVRPQFTPWLRQLCHHGGVENQESPEIRLSPPAMETLAIIAYREAFNTPATRAEIEAIRGVQSCMEILRQLLGKDLIRIAGRSTELGRPRLYRTTKKFLEVFGLKSLLQLPRVDLS